jgi:hypothetical protein
MSYLSTNQLDWKSILQQAVDANIVVYDENAYPGYFGYNLIKFTEEVMKLNYNYQLKYVYVPITIVDMYNSGDIQLIRFDELGKNNIYGKYLCEELDGKRAKDKIEWGIGCNEEQTCWLLMSF